MSKEESIVKIKEKRKQHVIKNDLPFIPNEANKITLPGVMSSRGCAYAGARGVVFGPIKDVANIIHGPIGCAYYAWDQRRHLGNDSQMLKKCFSTDLKEKDIVFGGEKKLYRTIIEICQCYKPAAVAVYATCPVGLIGDDLDAVCRMAEAEVLCPVIPVHTEGFKGVSQSKGHRVASDALIQQVVGTIEPDIITDYDVNIVGEYNIGGDAWELKRMLQSMGIRVHAVFTGDSRYKELASAHRVKLNLVHCQRSITSLAVDMKRKYDIPYIDISMFGIRQTIDSLQRTAAFFGLEEKAVKLINAELSTIETELKSYKNKFFGKKVGMYIGGSRAWHFIKAFEDLGMKVILTGSEFGHKIDYEKMARHAAQETIFVDDLNHYELMEFLDYKKFDLFASGIKEMYAVKSRGVPYINLHSYDSGGPYVGFSGLINLAHALDRAFEIENPRIRQPLWRKGVAYDGI